MLLCLMLPRSGRESGTGPLRHRAEAVAHVAHRLDERVVPVLDLAPQPPNVDVHRARAAQHGAPVRADLAGSAPLVRPCTEPPIVSPLVESVPPILYGGTERVASALTEELVKRGHDVTLFASGDSHTSAQLVACAPRALRLDPEVRDYVAYTLIECGDIYDRAREFDLIHNHVDYFAFPFARMSLTPTVTTVHGRLDLEEVRRTYAHFPEQRLISISHNQASTLPHANWIANVYNGIDMEKFRFRSEPGDYLVFLGRISPEKRPDRPIEIARDVGMRLLIAAKVDPADEGYYHAAVEPLINRSPLVEFVGEVDEAAKDDLLGGAYACLFPIDWPEPFGLTMIESMATG